MDFEPKGFRLHPSIRKGSKYRAEIPQRNYKPKITLNQRETRLWLTFAGRRERRQLFIVCIKKGL